MSSILVAENQIFDHYVEYKVFDESIMTLPPITTDPKIIALQPLFSSQGNNTLRETKGLTELKNEYGSDVENIKKYGKYGKFASQVLKGGGTVFTCRLTDQYAKKASMLFYIGIKTRTDIPLYERAEGEGAFVLDENGDKIPRTDTPTTNGFEVDHMIAPVDDFNNPDLSNVSQDDFTYYPVMLFSCDYTGEDGNNFGITIEKDYDRTLETSDGARYRMNVIKNTVTNGFSEVSSILDDKIYFSVNPDAVFLPGSNVSEYLDEFLVEELEGKKVSHKIFDAKMKEVLDILADGLHSGGPYDVDFLFMKNKQGYDYDAIVPKADLDIDVYNGVFLSGGHDGRLQEGITIGLPDATDPSITVDTVITKDIVENTREELLKSFFACEYDIALLDPRIVDCGIVFDADYSLAVKDVIITKLNEYRGDIVKLVNVPTGQNYYETAQHIKVFQSKINPKTGYMIGISALSGITTDGTKTNEKFPATYDISRSMCEEYNLRGLFSVFAGYSNAPVKYMKFDWLPRVTLNDTEIGPLRKAGAIFAMQLDKAGTVSYMSEDTQYAEKYSKLKSFRNAMVIGDGIRLAHRVLIKYAFSDSVETASAGLKEEFEREASLRYPGTINVEINPFQTKRDIVEEKVSCEVIFTLPGMANGFTVLIKVRRPEGGAS